MFMQASGPNRAAKVKRSIAIGIAFTAFAAVLDAGTPTASIAAGAAAPHLTIATHPAAAGVPFGSAVRPLTNPISIYPAPFGCGSALRMKAGLDNSLWYGANCPDGNSYIISYSPTTHKASRKKIPTQPADAFGITLGPNNEMWFTEWLQPKVGETTGTTISDFKIDVTGESNANDIVTGPDGNVWLPTDHQGFVRVTPDRQSHRFGWRHENSQPTTLVNGPDGNLWFIEGYGPCNGGKHTSIGYINPTTGNIDELNVRQGGNSFGIAAGPDGRMWFADPRYTPCDEKGRIGAIDTDGSGLQYYSPPGAKGKGFTPTSIVAGPDGNLYFGEYRSMIGQITPAGVITEYALPSSPNGPWVAFAICVGPDGNIWFNDVSSGRLGVWKIQ